MLVQSINSKIGHLPQINRKKTETSGPDLNFRGGKLFSKAPADIFERKVCYFKESKQFFSQYLAPLFRGSKTKKAVPSVVICGPDDIMLERFARAVRESCKENGINFTDMSADINSELFIQKISNRLKNNTEHYLRTKKRSVIYIDAPERLLSIDESEVGSHSGFPFSKEDIKFAEAHNNIVNVSWFKSVLDECSSLPETDTISKNALQDIDIKCAESKAATTFIFKTNRPQLIHPDFRDGKMEKFYVRYPDKTELEEIIARRLFGKKAYRTADIPAIMYISKKLANHLTKNKKENYTTKEVLDIVDHAYSKTQSDSKIKLIYNLFKVSWKTKPKTTAEQTEYNLQIKASLFTSGDEYETLNALKKDGALEEKDEKRLKEIIATEKRQLKKLMSKKESKLSAAEKILLKKLSKRYLST